MAEPNDIYNTILNAGKEINKLELEIKEKESKREIQLYQNMQNLYEKSKKYFEK